MRALLLLLSALILLEPTDGLQYDSLEEYDRKIADQAIKKANEFPGLKTHLDLSDISRHNAHTIRMTLKPTSCDVTVDKVHLKHCKIQQAKPQVACVACHGIMYCHFMKDNEKITDALERCLQNTGRYLTGGGHVMAQKGTNEGETGCLGCV